MLYGVKRALLFGDKIRWLLNDSFNDTLAAGAVNGTPATPGPGTRAVVDTGNQMSISGGNLVNGGGDGIAWGDPKISLDAVTRIAGRMMVCELTQTGGSKFSFVWTDAVNGAYTTWDTGIYAVTITSVSILGSDATPDIVVGSRTSSTSYKYASILKTIGSYSLIRGGTEYPNWTLLYFLEVDGTATLYPRIGVNTAVNGAVFTSDFLRVPQQLWLPTPLAYDTFTRGDGAIGSTEAAGPDAQTTPARAWTGATWEVDTNQAKNTPALGIELAAGNLTVDDWYQITATQVNHFFVGCAIGDCFRAAGATALDANNKVQQITLVDMFATFATGTPSVLISGAVTLDANTQAAGYITNLDDDAAPANFLIAYHDGTNAHLEKCVAGTYTSLINAAAAYAAGRVPRIHTYRDGANLKARLYYNDALIGAEQTIADAGIVDNVIHGQMSTNPVNRLDTFQLFARGEEGQYNAFLDKVVKE